MDELPTLEQINSYYQNTHLEQRESSAWQFLDSLDLDNEELSQQLGLGYADRSLNTLLHSRMTAAGVKQRKHLQELGLLRDTGFETLFGLTVPFYSESGEFCNAYSYTVGKKKGITHWLNDSGCIQLGNGSTAVFVAEPMDMLVLVGLNFHSHYRLLCASKFENAAHLLDEIETLYTLFPEPCSVAEQRVLPLKHPSLMEAHRKGVQLNELFDNAQSIAPQLPTTQASSNVRHDGNHHFVSYGAHHYRITGLERNAGFHSLKVTLKLWEHESYYIDTLDLIVDKQRSRYVQRAAEELELSPEILKQDLGKLLLTVERLQEDRFNKSKVEPKIALSQHEQDEAIGYLKAPDLIDRIQADFTACGIVGEELNRLVGYLCCTSRLQEKPLAVIVQSSSAAGKTTLMNSVLSLFPEEEQINYSALTGQSLYYLGDTNIDKKILSIAEEEGASRASYALKLLLSEGDLSIATTGKDPETGATTTMHYKVSGRVMLFLTTTALEIDEELMNRCIVLSVDESAAQTSAIHAQQRYSRTLEGVAQRNSKKQLQRLHHNIQHVLQPYTVINPFADELEFSNRSTRTRRDHEKYLCLIESIALLHQYQREKITKEIAGKTIEALVVDKADIELANTVAQSIFQTTLDDLPAHTRKVWNLIQEHVCTEHKAQAWHTVELSRRSIRELTGLSMTAARTHIARLIDAECLAPVRGNARSRYTYQLLIEPSLPTLAE